MPYRARLLPVLLFLLPLHSAAAQDLRLPAVLSDHAVLQRGGTASLWGHARAGAKVVVAASWRTEPVGTMAAADGRWRLDLPLTDGDGPFTITVRSEGEERLVRDVLIGEVWLCSGQSNMEMTVGPAPHSAGPVQDWQAEAAAADLPEIRFFTVERRVALEAQEDCDGTWVVVQPDTVGRCTAAGFFFAREVHARLGVPVGLLHSSWGGTVAEAWTSPDGLAPLGDFDEALGRIRQAVEGGADDPGAPLRSWWEELERRDPGLVGGWTEADGGGQGWGVADLPGFWSEEQGLDGFDGVVWYRRSFELPAALAGQDLVLELGPIDDMDTVWLDGRRLAGTEQAGFWNVPRRYPVPAALASAGRHVLAIRILDTGGPGGIGGEPEQMRLARRHGRAALRLDGTWQWRRGIALSAMPPFPTRSWPGPNTPTALYHGMITPLLPYRIRGVLWYQGEANRPRPRQYRRVFPALIADWRRLWSDPELPFLFVQIAPFAYRGDQGQAAELREAQFLTERRVPHTGMVVTMDIGNPRDIHPKNKQEVGRRLALLALRRVYGQDEVRDHGPIFREARREGSRLRLFFDEAAGGLTTLDGAPPSHLLVAGTDRVFHPAIGRVEGETLLAWSAQVPEPVAVRYAWGAADEPNLANRAGLPASSFRSDDWPRP